MSQSQLFTATIPSSGTLSPAVYVDGYRISEIICPVTTGTAITFEVSYDGVTYYPYKDVGGTDVTITKVAATASCHQFAIASFVGIKYVKVKSGSTEAAARSFGLVGVK